MNCDPNYLMQQAGCFRCQPNEEIKEYLLCQWANKTPPTPEACVEAPATDWNNRILAGGYASPSANTVEAVCRFCEYLRINGISDKMLVVNPIIPPENADSFNAMCYPVYPSGTAYGNSPWTAFNFLPLAPLVFTDDGLLGGGPTQSRYMDTGFVPNVVWLPTPFDSAGLSIYETQQTASQFGAEIEIGAFALIFEAFVETLFFLGTFDPDIGDADGGCFDGASFLVGGLLADTPAFYSLNRTDAFTLELSQQSNTIPFNVLATNANPEAGPAPDVNVYFMADNNHGVPDGFTLKRVSFAAIHEGLTQAEAQILFDAVYAMRVRFGGGYL